jgi:hypothetical protein
MQRGFHAIDHQGMPCVMAALEAHHTLCSFSQPVHQLAFAFIAPLRAHDDDVFTFDNVHCCSLKLNTKFKDTRRKTRKKENTEHERFMASNISFLNFFTCIFRVFCATFAPSPSGLRVPV